MEFCKDSKEKSNVFTPNEFLPLLQFLWAISKNLVKETDLTAPDESEELDKLVSVVATRYLTDQRRSLLSNEEQREADKVEKTTTVKKSKNEEKKTTVKKNKDEDKKKKKNQKMDKNKKTSLTRNPRPRRLESRDRNRAPHHPTPIRTRRQNQNQNRIAPRTRAQAHHQAQTPIPTHHRRIHLRGQTSGEEKEGRRTDNPMQS